MHWALRGAAWILVAGFASGAPAAPVSFAALARHEQYRLVKISPDGTHIAATSVLPNGHTVLTLIDLATHAGINVQPAGGDDVDDFWWASPRYVVYSVAEHQGGWDAPIATGELYSVGADGGNPRIIYGYRMDAAATGRVVQGAAHERGSARFLARIEGDSDHILVTISDWSAAGAAGALTEVDRLDVRDGDRQRVATAPMREASFLADHHGHVRFAMGDTRAGQRVIYLRPATGGDWQLLQRASVERDWPIAFSRDDRTVWFTCPGAPGFGICRFDPATRGMTRVWSNPRVEATNLARGLAHDSVLGVDFTDGRPAISVFDGGAPGVKALAELLRRYPGEDAEFVSGTVDGGKAIALVEADVDPGTYFLYDRATNKFTPLLQRAGWIDPNRLGRKVPFTFTTRDGLSEQGYITYPPGEDDARDLPLVVFVHGGPYGIRDWWDYDPYVEALATRGYAVLQVNYRGSGGYGFAFERAGWGQWGLKMQDDVTDATRWAIWQGIANPARICIYGGSYGGYAALEGAVKVPNLYRCAIGYVGVYDLRLLYTRGDVPQDLYGKDYLKRVLGTDLTALAERSPIYQLANLKAKVMLIVGGRDTRVPPVQGMDMLIAMQKRRLPVDWLYKPDEWHGFYNERDVAELFRRVDAFLASSIGPGAGAAGATAPPPHLAAPSGRGARHR